MLACRPLDPDLGWFDASKEWRVLGHEASLREIPCVLLERRELPYSRDPANNEQIVTLWVAPSRDYHVMRYSTSNGPPTLSELTIKYELEPVGLRPVPAGRAARTVAGIPLPGRGFPDG